MTDLSSNPAASGMSFAPPPRKKAGIVRTLRNRVLAGLFVVLPIFITWIVIKWLYDTLNSVLINPIARFLLRTWHSGDADPATAPVWTVDLFATIAAVGLVLGVLFIAGMFFRSRTHRLVDWIMLNVPGINTIYSAVRNVVSAVSSSQDEDKFKRVVLVQFPHPGMKVPAFVTSECRDLTSGRVILCVYVPTTPVPTSGYMLLVPEDEVVPVNWDLQETLQAIVSGGITVPREVLYDNPVVTGTPGPNAPAIVAGIDEAGQPGEKPER